jgi:hypothetical protein
VLMLDECIEANAVCTHPLVPIAVTAHEDKHIRMWDLSRYYSSAVKIGISEFLKWYLGAHLQRAR